MSISLSRRVFSCKSSVLRTIIRHASSKVPKAMKATPTLPDAKMRALISLYHQSESFVTRENLNKKIEEAFFPGTMESVSNRLTTPVTVRDLWHQVEARRKAPKTAVWDSDLYTASTSGREGDMFWSASERPKREVKVMEALYGVDISHEKTRQPGLEILADPEEDLVSVEEMLEINEQAKIEAGLREEEDVVAEK